MMEQSRKFVILIAILIILPCVCAVPEGGSYEPDDSTANATTIHTDGSWQTHNFTRASDNDYVNFTAVKGGYYLIQTVNLSSADITNTDIYLYDTDGTTSLSADSAGLVGSQWSAHIVWRATSPGVYYVKVVESNGTAGGSYNISVEKQGTLAPYLVNPSSWTNVSKHENFNFTAGVTCVGGPCRNIVAVLDPEPGVMPAKLGKGVAEALASQGEAKVIVKLKDSSSEDLTLDDISSFKKSKKARHAFIEQHEQLKEDLNQEKNENLRQNIKEKQDRVISRLDVTGTSGNGVRDSAQGSDIDFRLKHKFTTVNAFSGSVTDKGLKKLLNDPDVESVSLDLPVNIALSQSVPLINANDAWNMQVGTTNMTGEGQTICVIDTGINYNHPDFGAYGTPPNQKVVGSYCYCDDNTPGDNIGCCPNGQEEDTDALDDHSHGSHVAGIVASENNTYRGVAPGASIVAIKTMDSGGSGWMSDIISGIEWCVDNATALNISVISMSIGTTTYDNNGFGCDGDNPSVASVIDNAVAQGILVSIAAGNCWTNEAWCGSDYKGISLPACIKNATSVGITTKSDSIVSYGQRGFTLDMMAPGYDIYATNYSGYPHISKSGTSMSTPHVAGAAALLQQYFRLKHNRSISPREIEWMLKFNGVPLADSVTNMTYTRIDVQAAAESKGAVSTTVGATPFYTTTANPHDSSCLIEMAAGESCNVSWTVNATGDLQNYTFFTIFETDYMSNITDKFDISITDLIPPSLTIVSPVNNSNVSTALQSFRFNVSDAASSINCSLYFNSALVNNTVNSSPSALSYVIPSESSHSWYINCSDGQNLNISESRNINYDLTAPNITLGYPQDTAVLSTNTSDFIFYMIENVFDTVSCDLYVNSTKKASNSSVTNMTNTTFSSVSLPAGSLSWRVNCTDSSSNSVNSSSRTIIVPQENVTTNVNTTANTTFNINSTADSDINLTTGENTTGNLSVTQYNTNPENVSASSSNGFAALALGTFVSINTSAEISGNLSWYVLTMYYSTLPSNIDESTIRIYYFNTTSGQWQVESSSGVDTAANKVWANITHFSTFSAGGSAQASDPPSGGGGGGGGSGATASSEPIVVIPSDATSLVEAPKNQQISVVYEGQSYLFKVTDFSNSLMTMKSLPDFESKTILNGMSSSIDLDSDGKADIKTGYSGHYSGKAYITFYLVHKPKPIPLLPPAKRKAPELESVESAVEDTLPAPETAPVAVVSEEPMPEEVERLSFFEENRMFMTFVASLLLLAVVLFVMISFVFRRSKNIPEEKPGREKKIEKIWDKTMKR